MINGLAYDYFKLCEGGQSLWIQACIIVLDDEEVSYEGQKRQEEEPRIKYTRVIADLLLPGSVRQFQVGRTQELDEGYWKGDTPWTCFRLQDSSP
jgi:hypothetical protein